MLEETMIRQAAPTMAGIKAANLFPYSVSDGENLPQQLEQWNRQLAPKGIRTILIGCCPACPSKVLLYTYRPSLLEAVLQREAVRNFLLQYGYGKNFTTQDCLSLLSTRLCPEKPFPHEIGIFLGYPLEDVIGFIENNGENYLCSGLWKVYTDQERAEKRFWQFRRCTQIYCKYYAYGRTLNQLTVAV